MTARVPYRQTERRSKLLFHFRASDLEFGDPRNPSTGALKPVNVLTRQTVTFTRASTATAVDRQGATYTVGHSLPAWSWYAGKPALLIRQADGSRAAETCAIAFNPLTLAQHTGYMSIYAPNGAVGAEEPILHWGDAGITDATSWALVALESTDPNDLLELRWSVAANGAITIGAAMNGGTEQIGQPVAASAGVSVEPDAVLSLGSRLNIAWGNKALAVVKIAAGAHTMQQMRELF